MDTRTQEFLDYVQSGGQVETGDWMPDEYRARLVKFIEMHGNSELMGVLPERDWILRAPTLQRKLALTAKIQDEVGHAQLIYRVVEDLGKPRSACLDDLVSGKAKFHNVFHYPTRTWGDVGVIAWLVDAAAIVSQKALLKCSYAPYARIMKKICWEESFHILHGRDVILAMVTGTQEQFELVQEALDRWWEPLMHFHGNPIPAEEDPMYVWRIKSQANEDARQEFLDGYVPQIRELGLEIPDPSLRKDVETDRWLYTEPDWEKLRAVVTGHGPASRSGSRSDGCRDRTWRGSSRSSSRRRHEHRCLARARHPPRKPMIYEVFRQERKGQPLQHAGTVTAPNERFAVYAREQYGRRQESVALWLVPRDAVSEIDEFPDEFDLKYRRVDGSIDRPAGGREKAGTLELAPEGDR